MTADRVLVGNGAKLFLFLTILAVCEPGDEVIYPDPGFPIYESAIRWAGGVPVPLPLRQELDFSFSLDDLSDRLGAAHEARDPELAEQSDRRGGRRRRPPDGRRDDPREHRLGAQRRGLPADRLRRRGRLDREPARNARPHRPARRPVEDLRDDRLALRLRRRPGAARRSAHPADHELGLVRARLSSRPPASRR